MLWVDFKKAEITCTRHLKFPAISSIFGPELFLFPSYILLVLVCLFVNLSALNIDEALLHHGDAERMLIYSAMGFIRARRARLREAKLLLLVSAPRSNAILEVKISCKHLAAFTIES